MSREIHAGVITILPFCSSIFQATIAPWVTVPCEIGGLKSGCDGPQNGLSTQRVPLASSHVARLPHTPAAAKLTSSLHIQVVRKTGVRWSAPPRLLRSSRKTRHSLLEVASSLRPL